MQQTLHECRWLYNYLLAQRKEAWEQERRFISLFDQHAQLPHLKKERPSLTVAHSQVLQNVGTRLDLAFRAFFRRVKAGETPGYPRFRAKNRYDSFCYPQHGKGFELNDGKLHLSKIGAIKIVLHSPLVGTPKTCCIRRTPTGKWFALFACECESTELKTTDAEVGIDVGLTVFATLSTGETIENPRFFRKEEKELIKAQRRLEREAKGTSARAKRRHVISRIHERAVNRRKDFAHQQSRRIVDKFGVIAVENINVNRLVHNHCLAKSIADAAWAGFLQYLTYKAEDAGRVIVAVNPAYTSQTCSNCGHRQPMPLFERVYLCPCCGLQIDRDKNAAINILAVGRHSIRNQSVEAQPE